ncbi:MAG: TMEM165/GDT1 family protein [Deltaproteobacteria bacterium]|nr:TMEM165/GDT1 family protein [Deltaproteobacteria bacterium]
MDWKLFATTFGLVFMAELGDKTQLATLVLASEGEGKWMVFAGSALALVTTSALAVLGGELVSRVVPPGVLPKVAGVLFVLLGLWMILAKGD